ncbi:hypothetical protein KHU50_002386 [Colletotrichum sp. SAR 10_65]|nr:hypothetical protein KHU50_002386 [Colletotrichum sp. SAR 10_65]
MDPQPRPPRSALLAALRNNGTTEELRGIGYAVDLQGNWLADSLIFTTDRLEGNLDNLPLGPDSRTLILSTVPPTPAPLSAPSATLADSPVITSPAEYQDDYEDEEDEEDENEEDDAEGHYEDDKHTQISATVMWDRQPANPFVSPARVFAPVPPAPAPGTARTLAPTPTPSQTAPVPASSVVADGEQYQDEDKDGRDDTGPLAFPAPLPAPAPTASVPAPNVGVPAPAPPAHPPAIHMPSSSFPAGFRLFRMPNRTVASGRFLVGPGYGGRDVRPPPLNLEFLHKIRGMPKRRGSCAWCPCSKWLLYPYFFMRRDSPTGSRRFCNRCAWRKAANDPDSTVTNMNDWLQQNQPVMFQLVRGDRLR